MSQTQVDLILDGSIQSADIANSAVTTSKVANLNITTDKIADGAITKEKIASNIAFNSPFTTRGFSIPL